MLMLLVVFFIKNYYIDSYICCTCTKITITDVLTVDSKTLCEWIFLIAQNIEELID